MKLWDVQEQEKRKAEVQALHREWAYPLFNEAGQYEPVPGAVNLDADWRIYLNVALSLLDGSEAHVNRANALLRELGRQTDRDDFYGNRHNEVFWGSMSVMILARLGQHLDSDVRAFHLERLDRIVPALTDVEFRGYNDNYSAMAALTVIVGSSLIGRPEVLQPGIDTLRSLEEYLLRRGFLSEYTSPTYTPITLACLAEIVNLSGHEEARTLALQAEHRIWFEVATHFHRETSCLAGSHSRAYMADMCGHPNLFHIMMYQAFGDVLFVNPLNAMFPNFREGQSVHGNVKHAVGVHTTPLYHIPDSAAQLVMNKKYPFSVSATAEVGSFPRNWGRSVPHPETPTYEFPTAPTQIETYMTEDYALGTTTRPFCEGSQTTMFHLTFRKDREADRLEQLGTVFTRFVVNDKEPHRHEHMSDEGKPYAMSYKSTAMVLYAGRPAWGASGTQPDVRSVTSMKAAVLMTCFYKDPEEIWLGEQRMHGWQGMAKEPVPVFIRSGPVFMAVHPLNATDYGRDLAVGLEKVNGYGMINLYNFRSDNPRTFTDVEMFVCRNGFIFEAARESEWESFEAFRRYQTGKELVDRWTNDSNTREVKYGNKHVSLAMKVSPLSDGIAYRSVNGRMAEEPKLRVSGMELPELAWL